MRASLVVVFISVCFAAAAQKTKPSIEAYFSPGLFFEQLSKDSLVPAKRQGVSRLGDITAFGLQLAVPLKNEHWLAKAGVGFSYRHYSINKYSLDDLFLVFFLFDSPPRRDSFNISHVKFSSSYIQFPLSFSYSLTKPSQSVRLSVGLNIRPEILTGSKAKITFDSSYEIPSSADFTHAKDVYTNDASKFVLTAEPYIETVVSAGKKLGILFQFRPFSFYTSPLNSRLTTSTTELLGFTFGAAYKF